MSDESYAHDGPPLRASATSSRLDRSATAVDPSHAPIADAHQRRASPGSSSAEPGRLASRPRPAARSGCRASNHSWVDCDVQAIQQQHRFDFIHTATHISRSGVICRSLMCGASASTIVGSTGHRAPSGMPSGPGYEWVEYGPRIVAPGKPGASSRACATAAKLPMFSHSGAR
jgi:hypothetical protein